MQPNTIESPEKKAMTLIAQLFRTLSQPARLQILLSIGSGEACVCHLEANLGYRQAYISQQLMALREAELVTSRRDGRNIYYHLKDPTILDLIHRSGELAGLTGEEIELATQFCSASCSCPICKCDQER